MRWWAIPLTAIGLAQGASAGEFYSENLRGSIVPTDYVFHLAPPPSPDDTTLRSKPAATHAQPVAIIPPSIWNWTGFYIGAHVGAAMGLNNIADPLGASIFGDLVHSPGFFGGGQIGGNWQAPNSNWVFGVEADASLANLDGTNTCYGFSGTFTSFNCRANTDSFGTLTGRVGWAFGPYGRSLAYVKGGAAWAHSNVDMIINNNLAGVTGATSNSFSSWGWTVGAGAEHASPFPPPPLHRQEWHASYSCRSSLGCRGPAHRRLSVRDQSVSGFQI